MNRVDRRVRMVTAVVLTVATLVALGIMVTEAVAGQNPTVAEAGFLVVAWYVLYLIVSGLAKERRRSQ